MLFHAKIVVKINPPKLKGLLQSMSAILKLTSILVLYCIEHFPASYFLFICSQSVFFSNFDELFKISIVKPCDKNATLPARGMFTRIKSKISVTGQR